jgi:hypothetical protein
VCVLSHYTYAKTKTGRVYDRALLARTRSHFIFIPYYAPVLYDVVAPATPPPPSGDTPRTCGPRTRDMRPEHRGDHAGV